MLTPTVTGTFTETPTLTPTATATTPPAPTPVVIDYTYDPLYRLTAADYSTGEFYHCVYDAVGNRLSEETDQTTNVYDYDAANRLTSVNGVAYSWSNNTLRFATGTGGNLLSDGFTSYSYPVKTFGANGRLSQTVNGAPTNYTLDLNRGLTQVLADGSSAYLYGVNRIGELGAGGWAYYPVQRALLPSTSPINSPTFLKKSIVIISH